MKTRFIRLKLLISAVVIAVIAAGTAVYATVPDIMTDQTNANISFTPGELAMADVPSFDFGDYNITDIPASGDVIIYPAVNNISKMQVSDLRGTGAGWEVTVRLSPFTNPDRGPEAEPLKGAYIVMKNPILSSTAGNISAPPIPVETVTLNTNNVDTGLIAAGKQAGLGVWSLGWSLPDVTLNAFPGTLLQGQNTATLDWTLSSSP